MSFRECAEKYRSDMLSSVERGDRAGGRENAIAYAVLLRQAADRIKSYVDRAVVIREAEKYEYIAAVITKWGKCDEFYRALADPAPQLSLSNSAPSAKSTKKPVASGADARAAEPVKVPAFPSEPASPAKEDDGSDPLRALIAMLGGEDTPRKDTPVGASAEKPKATAPSVPVASPTIPAPGVEWIADAMDKFVDSVWIVRAGNSTATGFFITEDGYFLTNRHVVYDDDTPETRIHVVSHDEKKKYKARIQNVNEEFDVALLKVTGMEESAKPIPILRDYSLVRPGGDMMIIGNGLDFGLAPITGTIKYPKAKYSGDLVYTALTNNGDSGSPVLNRCGQLIGIHKSSTSAKIVGTTRIEAKGLSNATAACDILALLDKWGLKI